MTGASNHATMPADTTGRDAEGQLLVRLQAGEEAAFDELVRTHQEALVRFAARVVGDVDEASDVVQETFIRAYERIGDFRGGANLYTWLYRIAHNLAISHLRKKKVRRFLRLDHEATAGEARTAVPLQLVAADDPGADLERSEALRHIEVAIAALPPRQRSIFVLRHYEGLTHAQIALVVGRTEGAIRAGYFHAVRKLRGAARRAGLLDADADDTEDR